MSVKLRQIEPWATGGISATRFPRAFPLALAGLALLLFGLLAASATAEHWVPGLRRSCIRKYNSLPSTGDVLLFRSSVGGAANLVSYAETFVFYVAVANVFGFVAMSGALYRHEAIVRGQMSLKTTQRWADLLEAVVNCSVAAGGLFGAVLPLAIWPGRSLGMYRMTQVRHLLSSAIFGCGMLYFVLTFYGNYDPLPGTFESRELHGFDWSEENLGDGLPEGKR